MQNSIKHKETSVCLCGLTFLWFIQFPSWSHVVFSMSNTARLIFSSLEKIVENIRQKVGGGRMLVRNPGKLKTKTNSSAVMLRVQKLKSAANARQMKPTALIRQIRQILSQIAYCSTVKWIPITERWNKINCWGVFMDYILFWWTAHSIPSKATTTSPNKHNLNYVINKWLLESYRKHKSDQTVIQNTRNRQKLERVKRRLCSQCSLKERKKRKSKTREVFPAGLWGWLWGWLCAPVLLGGRGWLNKQS